MRERERERERGERERERERERREGGGGERERIINTGYYNVYTNYLSPFNNLITSHISLIYCFLSWNIH